MTLLVASIAPRNVADLAERASAAWAAGADAVEVRIDGFEGEIAALNTFLRKHPSRSWIVTCRSEREGGLSTASAEKRASAVASATAETSALPDFELADLGRGGAEPQPALEHIIAEAKRGKRLIVSTHDFEGSSEVDRAATITQRATDAQALDPSAVAKVAYPSETIHDSFAALDLMCAHKDRTIAIAMGEAGIWTRVLARKLGAFATFASLDRDTATAPGQLPLDEMIHRYRWPIIDQDTRVYGVLGDPVGHSMSPLIFNRWFADHRLDAVYLPLLVDPRDDGLVRFLEGCHRRPWLNVGGFSVTIPHKAAAFDWLGDRADWMSRWIGAVNTVRFDGEHIRGFNTDSHAAAASLAAACGCPLRGLFQKRIDVLGTGGAARAVLHGLCIHGARLTVYGRSPDRTKALADAYAATPAPWNSRIDRTGEIVVNTTGVGMWPETDATPMPPEALRGAGLVFDIVYNPLQTKLLTDAHAIGATALNGLDMFVRQAATQFELWTGIAPDRESAAALIRKHLGAHLAADTLDRPVALIGMRGSGKTCVGRVLAEMLAVDFVDSDELIRQETGKEIAAIFAEEGETGFRRHERSVIKRLAKAASGVISVGGGAVLDEQSAEQLRAVARIVWLTAPVDVLFDRIANDPRTSHSRPRLSNKAEREELRTLLAERAPVYERLSDFRVETIGRTPDQVAEAIVAALGIHVKRR